MEVGVVWIDGVGSDMTYVDVDAQSCATAQHSH